MNSRDDLDEYLDRSNMQLYGKASYDRRQLVRDVAFKAQQENQEFLMKMTACSQGEIANFY